jgi:hypothetical protein
MKKRISVVCIIVFSFSFFVRAEQVSVDTIFISLSDSSFQAMEYMRKQILFLGDKGFQKDRINYQDYLRCSVKYKGKSVLSKIRIKGDRLIHYEDGNTSYRVILQGDNCIMGMKKFSLQKPRTKNYLYESFFHKALLREDIIGLRYKFIRLLINKKDFGIYALEEFMDKRLIENAKRRDGPILHFSEDTSSLNLKVMDIEVFGKVPKDKNEISINNKAKQLLDDFKNKKLKVSEVFDIKKLGSFFALTDVLGFHHAAVSKSIRFYFNPISFKLEPIGFDGHYGTEIGIYITGELGINPKAEWFYWYKDWFSLLFSDPQTFDDSFYLSYIASLKRMSEKKYLDKLFEDLDPEIQKEMEILHTDGTPILADHFFSFGPDTFNFSKERLYERQVYISTLLENRNRIKAVIIKKNKKNLLIGIRNTERLPVELLSFIFDGKKIYTPPSTILPADNWIEDTLYSVLEIPIPNYNSKKELKIEYIVKGINEINVENVSRNFNGKIRDTSLVVKNYSDKSKGIQKYLNSFPCISYDPLSKKIEFIHGKWTLENPLIIPFGYSLIAKEGVEINLKNKAFVVSHSPIDFNGSENKFIKFFSSDSTGMGIFITSEGEINKMNYVEFNNLSAPSFDGWMLTGVVSFYESPVNINNCKFLNARSEDALNIIRSDFKLSFSSFQNTLSDAFDGDFAKGTIDNTDFFDCKNDGIDGSGSNIKIEKVSMTNIGDKGISAGESSNIIATNVKIQGSKIGFVSKDLSNLTLVNCMIDKCIFGMAAFRKKKEFGPSSIKAINMSITNVQNEHLVEEKSSISSNNKIITSYQKKVETILISGSK